MSTREKDYSSYLAYESFCGEILALFCGFTFTAITILTTLLPNPSQIVAQASLFFLAFMFYLFKFILFWSMLYLAYCVRAVPTEIRGRRTLMWLMLLSFSMWGVAIVLMFLLWNLTYLALASGIMCAFFIVLDYIFVVKPYVELSRRIRAKSEN